MSSRGLTLWGRATHIGVIKVSIISSDNDLSLGRRQAIFWKHTEISLMGSLGTNLSEILSESEIDTFSFKKMHLSSAK